MACSGRRIILLLLCGFSVSAGAQSLQSVQNSFIGGELSPLLISRPDSPRFATGCRTLENALVLDVGVAARRPGTVYVATAPGVSRLEPFVYDDNDVYVMEFSHELLRFYREVSGVVGLVLDINDVAYTLATPWDGNDIDRMNLYQKGDLIYVVHRDYSPRKIARYGHTNWTITDCNTLVTDGPFREENTDTSITITPPAATSDITAGETFDANNVFTTYAAANAFDDTITSDDCWISDEIEDTWISCQFATAKTITRVKIYPFATTGNSDRNPKHCKIEASDDGITWTKLSVTRWYGRCEGYLGDEIYLSRCASLTDYAYVYLDNETAYTYYRVWCYDNWGDATYLALNEIEMSESESGTFTTAGALWSAGHVGSLWQIRQPRSSSEVSGSWSTYTQWSEPIDVKGAWNLEVSGTWTGTLCLQRSFDYGASWEVFRTWSDDDVAPVTGIEEEANVWYRMNLTDLSAGTVNYSLSVQEGTRSGIIRITAYSDANTVTATVLEPLASSEPAYRWSEGDWSEVRGYPEAVAGHQARLIYARDLTLWWSATYQFETFAAGTNDDDAITFTLNQQRQNPIWWLIGDQGQSLVAGTMGRVLEIQPFDETTGFTPTNPPKVQNSIAAGSARTNPAMAEELLLYAAPSGRRIHELMYNSTSGSITAPDVTVLASHILGTGVRQMAWQSQPYPYLWVARNDGELASLYYNRPYEVAAWSHQETDGSFVSVAVTPRSGSADRVWFVVNRTIDGSSVYYVEYLDDLDLDADVEDAYYVDAGLTWSGGDPATITALTKANPMAVTLSSWPSGLTDGANVKIESVAGMTEINDRVLTADDCNSVDMTLTLDNEAGTANWNSTGYSTYTSGGTLTVVENTFGGLSHLEGEDVAYLADGLYDAENGTATVSGGSVELAEYANRVAIGLPYTTTITPISPDLVGSGASTIPFLKQETGVYLNVYQTCGGRYGVAGGAKSFYIRYPSTVTLGELYSGPAEILSRLAGPRLEAGYTFLQDAPYPFILKTAVTLYEVTQ
jgi:hypothetical protein